ncbi:MAG: hypothetical protein ACI8XO_005051 [Verrucomicrobiales bacterium]|jgi:hypothetical protein
MRPLTLQICVFLLFIPLRISVADDGIDLEKGREFWSFKNPVAAELPTVTNELWPRSSIDHFILAKLEAADKPAPEKLEKIKLLRRVYFDLHGLPPSPDQVGAFLADESSDAFEKLVDQLLASPHFGERWGRHWLDVVRFAESTGGGRTMLLRDSWRYRDYVVGAFNRDKPFDEFLVEQIAGDLLPNKNATEKREHLIATTFLALGPSNYELQDKEQLTMEIVDEQLDTVGRAFMAMTLGCARCHDHMFDPISARDYYALAGIFKSTKTVNHSNVSQWLMANLPPITAEEKHAAGAHAIFTKRLKDCRAAIKVAEKELVALEDPTSRSGILVDNTEAEVRGEWVISTIVKKWVGSNYIHDNRGDGEPREVIFTPDLPQAERYEVRVSYNSGPARSTKTPVKIRHRRGETTVHVNQRQKPKFDGLFTSVGIYEFEKGEGGSVTISNEGTDGVTIVDAVQWLRVDADTSLDEIAFAAKRVSLNQKIESLHKELKEITKAEPKVAKLQTMTVRDEAKPTDAPISLRGDVHSPGELVPRGVPEVIQIGYQPTFSDQSSGRLELARWLVAEDHPLTARVFVNRLWIKLMGEGLVATPDNFGTTGAAPSHPELLDYLALRLVENGWSIKVSLREMLLSSTYRSVRAQPRRLDAEALRDAILATSGRLDKTMGGASIRDGARSEFGYDFKSDRRSLYLPVFRNALPDLFSVFDFPDPNLVAGKRNTSTLTTQALYFMNHPFVIEQSKHAAAALGDGEVSDRIELAYRRALGRPPGQRERNLAEKFLGEEPGTDAWAAFYQSLFACLDFRFVD